MKGSKVVLDGGVKVKDKLNIEEEEGEKGIMVVGEKEEIMWKWSWRECCGMGRKEGWMKY